jgi:formylglycine-generating enzyme
MATPDLRYSPTSEPVMRRVPAGWFEMGCDAGRDDEKPAHRVWVDAFELAAFQTPNGEYARFLQDTGSPPPALWDDPSFNHPEQPVVAVSWFDAVAYCDWLSRALGKKFRLPTEAEWERAARGGVDGENYPWGNCAPEELPNYASRWKSGPEPVGLHAPNPYGLYNVGDNVHEWCADWYDAAYYPVSPERNPRGPISSSRRASRGGSWRHQIKVTRTAARSSIPPELKYADYGFRVAASGDFLLEP